MDASACTVILAALTAIAAIAYTYLTYRLLQEAQRQTEAQIAPVLELTFDGIAGHAASLENIGKGVAVKGRLTATRMRGPNDLLQPEKGPGTYAESLPLLKPGQTHSVDLRQKSLLGEWNADKPFMHLWPFHFLLEYESVSGTKHFSEFHAEEGRIDPGRTRYGWNARGRAPGR